MKKILQWISRQMARLSPIRQRLLIEHEVMRDFYRRIGEPAWAERHQRQIDLIKRGGVV